MWTESLEPRKLLSSSYQIVQLVSDGAVSAAHIDKNLVNPWGIIVTDSGVRVVNNGTGTSTRYDGHGNTHGPIIDLPGGGGGDNAATGLVANNTSDFVIHKNGKSAPAAFISVGEDGGIVGYNGKISSKGILAEDSTDEGAIYKGAAIASSGGKNYLYAADFHNKRVAVYNGKFNDATLTGNFKDSNLPSGYAPFNIASHEGHLYITFAKPEKGSDDEVDGAHLGLVDEFNTDGTFDKRIATGGTLNAPWGMAFADKDFGGLVDGGVHGGDLLVGNFGDGRINVVSSSGKYQGQLKGSDGHTLQINRLWGIAFGNDKNGAESNRLYFAAGSHDEADGLFGYIHAGTGGNTSVGQPPSGSDGGDALHSSIVDDVLG